MRVFSVLFVVLSAALVHQLHSAAATDAASRFEADVLRTLAFTLGSGLALNVGCALVARRLDAAVLPGTEMWSCAPYGTIGGALVTRAHIFGLGGYKPEHWAYAYSLPRRAQGRVRDAVAAAVRLATRDEMAAAEPVGTEQR